MNTGSKTPAGALAPRRSLGDVILRAIFWLFFLLFSWILLSSIFYNRIYERGALPSLLLMLAFLAVLLLIRRAMGHIEQVWARFGWLVCAAVVVFGAAAQLAHGYALRFDPAYDLDAIFGGGRNWARDGLDGLEYYLPYFNSLTINMGGLFFFRCLFGLGLALGGSDFFTMALWCNVLLLAAAVVAGYDLLRRLAGHTTAVFSLVCYLLFFPYTMMGAVFYTDLLSALFPILVLDLCLAATRQVRGTRRLVLFTLAGLVAGVGAVVKFSVLVALIAAMIAVLVAPPRPARGQWLKQAALPAAAAALACLLVLGSFRVFVQKRVLDDTQVAETSFPLTHWVAMGLIGDGGYDEDDFTRMQNLPDKASRVPVTLELIRTRLSEPGPLGLAGLFTRKMVRCFGDGTYDLSIFLDDNPHQNSALQQWVFPTGSHYGLYSHLSQGLYLAMLALALLPAALAALRGKKEHLAWQNPGLWLAFLGLALFLLMWETNSRYTLNYMPVLFCCGAVGATRANALLCRRKRGQSSPP